MDENKTNSEPNDSVELPPTQHDELRAEHHQPTQAFAPAAGPSQTENPEQPIAKPSNFGLSVVIAFGLIQLFGLLLAAMDTLFPSANDLGTNLIIALLFVPAILLSILGNIIMLPIYLLKNKIRGIGLLLGIGSWLMSISIVVFSLMSG